MTLILATATALRLQNLGGTSVWYDEAVSWSQAQLPFLAMVAATAQDNYPPLHNIILWVTIHIFGDSETALRAPSLVSSIATIYLVYKLGSYLWDRGSGLAAAFLLSLSGFHYWYSMEARMYALLGFTSTLFVLSFVTAIGRPTKLALVGCCLAGVALLYTHVYGSFVFFSVNLVFLIAVLSRTDWPPSGLKALAVSQVVAVVLFQPWSVVLSRRLLTNSAADIGIGWIPKASIQHVLTEISHVAGGNLALIMLIAISSVALVYAVREVRESKEIVADWGTAIVSGWFAGPILIGYVASLLGPSIFIDRYLIGSLPALFLLTARGVCLLFLTPLTRGIALAVVIAVSAPSLRDHWVLRQEFDEEVRKAARFSLGLSPLESRDDNRSVAQEFSARYMAPDRVVFPRSAWAIPFRYYFREPITDFRSYPNGIGRPPSSFQTDIDVDRFWLMLFYTSKREVSKWVSIAERTHHMTYSYPSKRLRMFLFERR